MLIWAIISTIVAVVLLLILIQYKRQVKYTCRCICFNQNHTTNRRLLKKSFKDLEMLNEEINSLLNTMAQAQVDSQQNEAYLKATLINLSHDIRTPLTSLKGYFQLMEKSESKEDRERYAKIIESRIMSLQDMLEELFTYAKLKDKDYDFKLEKMDMTKVCCDVLFSFYEDFKKKGIEPKMNITEERLFVNGNREALSRAVQNIVKNALVHGLGNFEMSLQKAENRAVFRLSNNIENPEKVDIEKIFDRFYKADSARSKVSTGLGLSISKELTEKMGGQIKGELKGDEFSLIISMPIILQ